MSLISDKQAEWQAYQAALETFHETTPKPEDLRLTFGTDSAVVYQPEEDSVKVYSRGGIMRFRPEDAQAFSTSLAAMFAEPEPEPEPEPEEPEPEEPPEE
jgi:hypothetical protein